MCACASTRLCIDRRGQVVSTGNLSKSKVGGMENWVSITILMQWTLL